MDIFEYLKNEIRTFSEKPFSVLDSIVLSKLAYLKFDEIVPKEGIILADTFKAEYYYKILNILAHEEEFKNLYILAVLNPRFRDIKIKYPIVDSDPKNTKQFAAVTFILGDKMFIAYRGTDTSTLSWKENFQMTYEYPVESQKEAVKYLKNVYLKEKRKMLIGGHSKGGNLSIYASINIDPEIQKEIVKIYSLDGSGFPDEVFESKEYKNVSKKILKIVPYNTLLGITFQKDNYLVCKSNVKGIWEHEPMFWQVKDNDLVYLKSVSKQAGNFANVITKWFEISTIEERKLLADTLFSLYTKEQIPNMESKTELIQVTTKFIQNYANLGSDKKELILNVAKSFANIVIGRNEKENNKKINIKSIKKKK